MRSSDGSGGDSHSDAEILLVERDEGLREPFRIWLAERWTVTAAADANEALAAFSPAVDAVVTSDRLLLRTPTEFLSELAERGYEGPAVVLGTHETAPDAPAVDVEYVLKPVDRPELVDSVAAVLD